MRQFVVTCRGTDHVIRASHAHIAARLVLERLGLDRGAMWRLFPPRVTVTER